MNISSEDSDRLIQLATTDKGDTGLLARVLLEIVTKIERDEEYERGSAS